MPRSISVAGLGRPLHSHLEAAGATEIMASHRFIISEYKYKKHNKLAVAQAEKSRLEALHPEKTFRIYTVMKGLDANGNPKKRKLKQATPLKITLANFKPLPINTGY